MDIYLETNRFLESCFRTLEASLPHPVGVQLGTNWELRYEHQVSEIAILQKLARYISGLNAGLVLLQNGYTQELGVLFRTLDEFGEDISFLALPIISGHEFSDTHEDYLKYFFQEEFDNPDNALQSKQNRPTIPRRKIQAELAKSKLTGGNPSDMQNALRTVSQAYSGFVHGASVHILDMVGGDPCRYYLRGMRGTPRSIDMEFNYWDYAYRGIVATNIAGKALGSSDVDSRTKSFIDYFEFKTGDTGKGDPKELLSKTK